MISELKLRPRHSPRSEHYRHSCSVCWFFGTLMLHLNFRTTSERPGCVYNHAGSQVQTEIAVV